MIETIYVNGKVIGYRGCIPNWTKGEPEYFRGGVFDDEYDAMGSAWKAKHDYYYIKEMT